MIIITNYKTIKIGNCKKIINLDKTICNTCNIKLKIIGSRKRKYISEDLNHEILIIKRLQCPKCKKIHHELPDFIVPYKRHHVNTIERAIDKDTADIPCETSTFAKIRDWFKKAGPYFAGCLASLWQRLAEADEAQFDSLPESMKRKGWLGRLVKIVANSNLWPQTRSAFCL
jgi:hypothetical protein